MPNLFGNFRADDKLEQFFKGGKALTERLTAAYLE